MHINSSTVLIVAALLASLALLVNRGDRVVPVVAFVAAGLEALMAFGILTLALARFRIDIILPGLLLVPGAICWSQASSKTQITAATVLTMVGGLQLALALRLLA